MSSFAAFLHVQGGVRYPLLTYSLAIHQQTDSLGRPASPTQGGTIDCTLNVPTTDRSAILRWMLSPTTQLDGEVLLMQDVPRTILKSIAFFNAYCVGLTMQFRSGQGGGGSLQMQVRISPQRVAVGPILHDNNWPVESHGAGQSHTENSISKKVHRVLDAVDDIGGFGIIADVNDAALYAVEGNWKEASKNVHEAIDKVGNVPGLIGVVAGVVDTALYTTALYTAEGNREKAKEAAASIPLGVIPGGKLLKKTALGRKLLKNIWRSKALERLATSKLLIKVEKQVNGLGKKVRRTKSGRRLLKSLWELNSLKRSIVKKLTALFPEKMVKFINSAKKTTLSKKIAKGVIDISIKKLKDYIKSESLDLLFNKVGTVDKQINSPVKQSQKEYSIDPREVRRVLDAKLKGEPYDEDQFMYYHLNRNKFNVGKEVTSLTRTGLYTYEDNFDNEWRELFGWQNIYHMPDGEKLYSSLPFTTPYSRKFVRPDTESGLDGEFEMIIKDRKRIDSLVDSEIQETYNFARTNSHPLDHIELDVNPHKLNHNYTAPEQDSEKDMGSLEIDDKLRVLEFLGLENDGK